tara:strand:- start:10 stop:576 length:567 start_codon:yes stop_codon:yes gene_type:complete
MNTFIQNNFKKVIYCSKLANGFKNDLPFHNYYRLKKNIKKGKSTYCGLLQCGITSFILGNILKKNGYPVNMVMYELGYGRYREDHVFLKVDNLIIDPTYRQFFTDDTFNGISKYNNYLYNELPPFFVGTEDELFELFIKLRDLNKNTFEYCSIKEDILDNWNIKKDITSKLDYNFNIIHNKNEILKIL